MLKPERICSLFPVRRSTRIKSVSSARALWLAKERAAPPLACRKYKVIPSAEICGEKAYPSEEIWRSPFASCIHTVPCALPTEVISDFPSGDQAAEVQWPSGPIAVPAELPSSGTSRQRSHSGERISTATTNFRSGEI